MVKQASNADLVVRERIPHVQGQTLKVSVFGKSYEVEAPVAGSFQAENILCALGLAIGTSVPVDRAIAGISRLAPVPGRLELAAVLPNGAAVYVDYAHTPDALDNVLRSLRPHVGTKARLHALFGCGGDRDTRKRPIMGRIAEELADCVWVTDDNPRTEDPDSDSKTSSLGCDRAQRTPARVVKRCSSLFPPCDQEMSWSSQARAMRTIRSYLNETRRANPCLIPGDAR